MFLNESVKQEPKQAVEVYAESNPAWMLSALAEADEAYHNLTMKMIKCEHSCIVNENTEMLQEAEGEFGKKVAAVAKAALEKFLAFIDRVRAEWSKLYSNVISKFAKSSGNSVLFKNLDAAGIQVELKASATDFQSALPLLNRAVSLAEQAEIGSVSNDIEKKLGRAEGKATLKKVTLADVKAALSFLEQRPIMIKDLEVAKKTAIKHYKQDTEKPSAEGSLAISRFSRMISKLIMRINGFTSDAVKIVRAAWNADKTQTSKTKEQMSKINKMNANKAKQAKAAEKAAAKQESASILDQF